MKNVAVILARSGSKRIPNKNLKEFCGKPMISWPIKAALESNCFEKIIVSTDSREIAEISKEFGAEITGLREDRLSDDSTTSTKVMSYEASKVKEEFDLICCIYGSAPLVKHETIVKALDLLSQNQDVNYVFPVTEFSHPPSRGFRLDAKSRLISLDSGSYLKRTQDIESVYHDAGQFYFGKPEAFIKQTPIFDKNSKALVLPRTQVCDIDSEEDWEMAEILFKNIFSNVIN